MPLGPNIPTLETLGRIGAQLRLDISMGDLEAYRDLMTPMLHAYRQLDEWPEKKLPVKYPRTPGWRPLDRDNPLNGWYWRCEVKGATEGVLKGKRIGLKDVICVAGVPMMNGSRILEGYVPDIDATVVTRILDAGGTIVGKTSADDLSFAATGQTCSSGQVANPYDPARNSGGSSAGNAVVLYTGDADMTVGSDQGGSIRTPASWSGCFGLKPTFGLVPYSGCMGLEMTVDHLGPMCNSTRDVALLLSVIAGVDGHDPRQANVPATLDGDYLEALDQGVAGMRIGIVREGFSGDVGGHANAVDQKVRHALSQLEKMGAVVEEISLPAHLKAGPILSAIFAEGATSLLLGAGGNGSNWVGWYNTGLGESLVRGLRSRPDDLPNSAKVGILLGEYLRQAYLGRYYGKAQNLRYIVVEAYQSALASFDLLAMPTNPFVATARMDRDAGIRETVLGALDMQCNTRVANLTGHPSISVPCGMIDGLPVGLMLTARCFDEKAILAASAALEGCGDWKAF